MSIVHAPQADEKDGNNVTSQDTCPLFKTMLSRYEAVVRDFKQHCLEQFKARFDLLLPNFSESIPKTVRSIN